VVAGMPWMLWPWQMPIDLQYAAEGLTAVARKRERKVEVWSRLSAVRDQPGGILESVQHHLSVASGGPVMSQFETRSDVPGRER
jgi:hypothetical protein